MAEKSSFMGKKIEFQGKKSSFKLFGKIEFPSKRTKKAWSYFRLLAWSFEERALATKKAFHYDYVLRKK